MQSKGNTPTAEQKRWYATVAAMGCVICGSESVEIHHPVGASAKSNKIKIGNWFVLPLTYWHHRDQKNQNNVDIWKNRFESTHGSQKELFDSLVNRYIDENQGKMPFSTEIYRAIMSY